MLLPSFSMIPYGKQSIDDDDIAAVVEVLQSNFLTGGPKVEEFETAFAEYVGANHAVSCANGTAALHLAMLAAGIGPGDRVVTSPITFLASANCAAFVGATPDFCDIEPIAATIDVNELEQNWKPDTKAVVAVDYAGHPANHHRLGQICHDRGALLIEDACHSLGGSLFFPVSPDPISEILDPRPETAPPQKTQSSGSWHRIGNIPGVDMTTFSFHPVKTITTGEGGMVTTSNDAFAERLRLFRNHGIVRDRGKFIAFGRPERSKNAVPGPTNAGTRLQLPSHRHPVRPRPQSTPQTRSVRRTPGRIVACYNKAFADFLTSAPRNWLLDLQSPRPYIVLASLRTLRIDFDAIRRVGPKS